MTERDDVQPRTEPAAPAPDRQSEEIVLEAGELAPHCLALIDRVRRTGDVILIVHRGRPVARLLPLTDPMDEDDEPVDWDLEAIGP